MSKSYYRLRPNDPKAYYLDQGFGVHGDGKTDDTEAIRAAIRKVHESDGIGIVFVPEGEYLISDTIVLPRSVRLIGFGENRPRIRLIDNAPGFDQPVPGDKGGSKYMIWFSTDLPSGPDGTFMDANAGTFSSSLENIDLYVGQGNTNAIAVRSHVAQNSFIAHCDFHIESGRAGIFDVGNEAEDLHFYGGQYGIISTQCSPGWPFVLLDSSFEGHSKAAVSCSFVGFTAIRNQVRNTPTFLHVPDGDFEKLFMQDCLLENVSDCVISTDGELCPSNQQNALNIHCKNVPVFFKSRKTGETISASEKDYLVEEYHYGLVVPELGEESRIESLLKTAPLEGAAPLPESDLPPLPDMSEWVNIRTLGARGDGRTDDTDIFKMAVEKYRVIYVPQGVYVLTDTIKLKKDTVLIGLHCYATQLYLADRTPSFNGFGSPKALLEIPEGGDCLVNGFGIDTGGANQRVSGIIWRGSERSCLRDIRFVGGHGTFKMTNDAPVVMVTSYNATGTDDFDPLRDWDNQYPCLWVQGGGGVFKDIWAPSSFTSMGLCVQNTTVPGKIYCMSLEHHMRWEACFINVENWSIYGIQTEEVPVESLRAMTLEFSHCRNILLGTVFSYRVSRMRSDFPHAIRTSHCENIEFYGMHNFSQSRYVYDAILFDETSGKTERCWELTRLSITKPQPRVTALSDKLERIHNGFWFADGSCTDSKGNFYFTDMETKRIYRIDGESLELTILHELNHKPVSLICDTQDNLIIVAEYIAPRSEATWDGPPRQFKKMDYTVVFTINEKGEYCPLPVHDAPPANANLVYSGTRRHIRNDFLPFTMNAPKQCFVAPDGITAIPMHDDILRSRFLTSATVGNDFLCVDEFCGRTFRFTINEENAPSNPQLVVERGESCALARDGKIYVCDGQVSIYSPEGEKIGQICVPERPSTISFGGKNNDTLFITARTSIYACKL